MDGARDGIDAKIRVAELSEQIESASATQAATFVGASWFTSGRH
jgi:hypothetical protein